MKLMSTMGSILLGSSVLSAQATDYYVSTTGTNDPSGGAMGAPFATISFAVTQMGAGDSCFIRGGRYHEEITVSNTDDLTFFAYNDETVILDGSAAITNNWTPHSGNIYKTTLTAAIWQLFADGEMMIPARWPNADPNIDFWEQWESDHWGEGRAPRNSVAPTNSNGVFYDKPHSDIDLAASGLNISNAIAVLNVGSFRTWTRVVDSHVPGSNMFTHAPVSSGGYKDKEHYYFVVGKLELLDAENEWFFDTATSNLYVWVPGGGNPAALEIKGKKTTYCFTATDCDDLLVSGIDFFAGTFNLDGCLRARVENGELTYPSCTRRMLRIIETPQTTQVNSDFAEVYNCTFAYTDGHGISVSGDDSTIENCYFHHIDYSCSELPSVMPALNISGDRVTFRHNTLHSFGASVGLLQGNVGTTEYNNFYNGGYKQHDGAMVQVLVAKQTDANIGWNWVHDWSRLGIRFDGSGGIGGRVHHSVGWGPNMNSTVFIGNHENNEIINNSGIYSSARPEIVVESAPYGDLPMPANTNTITRNNFARQIAGTTTDGSPVPGIYDHNWDGYDLGMDIRTQLRDPDNLDYRPIPGADIVDAGVVYPGVTDGYVGDAPDIGAYEYGASNFWIAGHKAAAASMPIPPEGTTDAKGSASLIWQPALDATSSEVYLGTDSNSVANATPASPEFKANVGNNIYDPLGLFAQPYYWRIDSVTPTGTVTGEVWSFTPASATVQAPGIVNTAAENVSTNSAILGGQITDGGTGSRVWIHWWSDGGATNVVDMGAQSYTFALPLSGLPSGTLHNYRCYAENSYGSSWAAPVETFTTISLAIPPEVINSPAENITTNSATIGGQITNGASDSEVSIHWWADGGATNIIGMGIQANSFSTNLLILSSDTLYNYRCQAANAHGTNWAPTVSSFMTDTVVDPSSKVAVVHIPVSDDSWVQVPVNDTVNHGAETIIKIRGTTRFGYLKFDTGDLDDALFDSARVFIRTTEYITNALMHSVSSNDWAEGTIVGINAPVRGPAIDTVEHRVADEWVEFDTTSWITNKGVWTVGMSSPITDALDWYSKESGSVPYLAVSYISDTADLNTNNIPDWWETDYFGHIVDNTDADLDGVDNFGEYVADTDPTNSNSVFAVSGSPTNTVEFALSFLTSTNRNYAVEMSENLVSNVWNTATNLVPGTGHTVDLPLPATEQESFYRVEVSIP
ncbi:hypothetical protein SCARR_05277 [Pontiella sulfatireligans]|uniref:Ig-like domain-containing protein n=2 Tax=Pontiella sulfatireligans TaxID=2750658 RepID=A0A6C2US61_9BACT|nr:hypothetical protein SCARR_05277 [Pontiella sulfatireligans]